MNLYMGPLLGGLIIGLASSIMLWGLGRITGISGIYSSVLTPNKDSDWKYSFLAGLVVGGLLLRSFFSETLFNYDISGSTAKVLVAGLLVGFGTRLGSGCTSGHGVCGIPRLAKRSIIATLTFMMAGMIIIAIERALS